MEFIDSARIFVKAGSGGNGMVSFRREKYVPNGGPDGGAGGNGASVYFVASRNLWTLRDFKYQQHYVGTDGRPGGSTQKTGRSGADLRVEVPVGTILFDDDSGAMIADLSQAGQEIIVARGGRGGRGNMSFATPTNQAPRHAEEGKPGEEKTVRLELKLLADVAMVGFPNAGKSTLLKAISKAKPKVADYPFTTLEPHLGWVDLDGQAGFVVADIPGLIAGAHAGKGLGIRFLKHLERSLFLWIVLDASDTVPDHPPPLEAYRILCEELRAYKEELCQRPQIVLLNKKDLHAAPDYDRELCLFLEEKGIPYHRISGLTHMGLRELLRDTQNRLQALRPQTLDPVEANMGNNGS